jgi:hypothetical protein
MASWRFQRRRKLLPGIIFKPGKRAPGVSIGPRVGTGVSPVWWRNRG